MANRIEESRKRPSFFFFFGSGGSHKVVILAHEKQVTYYYRSALFKIGRIPLLMDMEPTPNWLCLLLIGFSYIAEKSIYFVRKIYKRGKINAKIKNVLFPLNFPIVSMCVNIFCIIYIMTRS